MHFVRSPAFFHVTFGLLLSVITSPVTAASCDHSYDFIIVGGGSAGLIVADRLSASGTYNVAVIEAGSK
jgi:ribulose 1,5-bisphosphate synthetase/thiazole synthase